MRSHRSSPDDHLLRARSPAPSCSLCCRSEANWCRAGRLLITLATFRLTLHLPFHFDYSAQPAFQFEQQSPLDRLPRHPLSRRRRWPLHVARRPHRPPRTARRPHLLARDRHAESKSSTRSSCSSRSRCSASSSRSTSSSTTPSGSSRSFPWRFSSPSSAAPTTARRAPPSSSSSTPSSPRRSCSSPCSGSTLAPAPSTTSSSQSRTHQNATLFSSSAALWLVSLAFLVAFAVKVPVFPLHGWLGRCLQRSPHRVAMVVAGKLGLYSILRFSFGIFPCSRTASRPG